MARDTRQPRLDEEESARPDESFLQRFHRRKTEARRQAPPPADPAEDVALPAAPVDGPPAKAELTDADMPPLDSLDAQSDYSGFLSAKVSETLRRAALRKLFHSSEFNVPDGLDDYAEDFTAFAALGDVVTADMRHRLAAEARRQAEAIGKSLVDEEAAPASAQEDRGSGTAMAVAEDAAADSEEGATPPPPNQTT
jgi:hypothetical protein